MMLRATRKPQNTARAESGLPRDVVVASTLTMFLLVMIGGFISAHLALVATAIIALGLFLTSDRIPEIKFPRLRRAANDRKNPLNAMHNADIKTSIRSAIEKNAVHVSLQPIVTLPQRQTVFQEIFSHIESGKDGFMPAAQYIGIARKNGTIEAIDTAALKNALKIVATSIRAGKYDSFFVNISTQTLTSGDFMQRLLSIISRNTAIAPFMIFEISQQDFETMDSRVYETLAEMSQMGCRFSIDNVRHFDFNMTMMRALNVRFVKLDANTLLRGTKSERGIEEIKTLKSRLERNDITPIVEKVESEYMLKELLDFGFLYGQGYLFSKPKMQIADLTKAA